MNLNKTYIPEIRGNILPNIWLIQMPNNVTKFDMTKLFLATPLQFDTMAFGFTMNSRNCFIIEYHVF